MRSFLPLLLAPFVLLAGCERVPPSPPPDRLVLTRVAFERVPGWREDDVAAALAALVRSCDRLAGQPAERPLGPDAPGAGGLAGTVADWRPVCAEL
ncbi:MAG TPA: murein transglycosylase, partial [Kiloniellales bacterium]|nr:murein transglycosylase [Kiloniellales bacterium]